MGIEKSIKMAEKCNVVLAIFDTTRKFTKEDINILDIIKDKNAIILLNKTDKKQDFDNSNELKRVNKKTLNISAINKEGIDSIYKEIVKMFNMDKINMDDGEMVVSARHKGNIVNTIKHLEEAKNSISNSMPVDIVGLGVKAAMEELSKITGENVTEDVIKEIFKNFCLGK
jgi:tRNA modification GTPase